MPLRKDTSIGYTIGLLNSLKVEQMVNKKFLHRLSIPTDSKVTAIAFHPTAQAILIGTRSGNIKIFDLVNGAQIHTLSKYHAPILAIGFNEDTIYTFNEELEICCWDLESFAFKGSHYMANLWTGCSEMTNHPTAVKKTLTGYFASAQFDPKGRYLICDLKRDCFYGTFSDLFKINLKNYCIESFSFPSDSRDAMVLRKIAISRDGLNICSSGYADFGMGEYGCDYIDQWNLEDGTLTCSYVCNDICRSHFSTFAQSFSPDGKKILVSLDGRLTVIDVGTGQIESDEEREYLGRLEMDEIEWSPVSDLVTFAKEEGVVGLYHMQSRKIIFEEKLFPNHISCIQFSSDGCFIGAFSDCTTVEIIQVLPNELPRLSKTKQVSSNAIKSYREMHDINEIILKLCMRFPEAQFEPMGVRLIEINCFLCLPIGYIDHLDEHGDDQTDLEQLVHATQDVDQEENQKTLKSLFSAYHNLNFYQLPWTWKQKRPFWHK